MANYRSPNDTPIWFKSIDGGELVFNDPTLNEVLQPVKEHGFWLDNCDAGFCSAFNFRGTAATLTRSAQYGTGRRTDMPALTWFTSAYCRKGIQANAVDWMIDNPRVCSFVDVGIDWTEGASACRDGQIYGSAGIGGITRPGASKVSIGGTEFSDCRKGLVLLSHYCNLTGVCSERCGEHNLLIGGQTEMSALDIVIEEFTSVRKDWTPTAVELLTTPPNKPHPEFGNLNANWSQVHGGSLRGIAIKTTKSMRLLHINGAHMVSINDVAAGGYPGTETLRIDNGAERPRVRMPISGGRVILRDVGGGGLIELFEHNGNIVWDEANTWDPTTIVRINSKDQKPGKRAA